MSLYAEKTTVSVAQSQKEIDTILRRYGATALFSGWDSDHSYEVVTFRLHGRVVRLSPPKVDFSKKNFSRTASGAVLNAAQRKARLEQAPKQASRALTLYIKATCEAIENEIVTIDEAFMPFLVLPNGATMGEWVKDQMQQLADNGKMPPLLPGG